MDFAHIKTIKNPEHNQQSVVDPQTFIRKTSFAAETQATLEDLSPTSIPSITTLSGNIQGGTFAQRARAAELQAARARTELKSKDPQAPASPPPRRLLTLKMPRRQKWTPLDLATHGIDPSVVLREADPDIDDSEQLPDGGNAAPDSHGAQRHEASNENAQSIINTNTNQRLDNLSSRLYGSLPASILQSQDLAEYPVELGARIESSIVPLVQVSTLGHSSQPKGHDFASSPQYQSSLVQQPFASNEQKVEAQQRHVSSVNPQPQGFQPLVDFNSPRLSDAEQEVLQIFANNHAMQYYQPLSASDPPRTANDGLTNLSDPFPSGISKGTHAKSYTAVRGTPAALNNNNARLAPMNPTASPFFSTQSHGSGTRRPSDQDRDFLVRHLNSFADDNPSVQTQQARCNINPGSIEPTVQVVNGQPPLYDSYSVPRPRQFSGIGPTNLQADAQAQLNRRRTGIWKPDKQYRVENPNAPEPKSAPEPTAAEKRAMLEREVAEWWVKDNRFPHRDKTRVKEAILAERHAAREKNGRFNRFNLEEYDCDYENVVQALEKDAAAPYKPDEMVETILIPAITTLASYSSGLPGANPFSKPPSWAIDHGVGGNSSFFSQQWGTPPQRVGRDPRYRSMQHDGRSSVFEDPTGRNPREEFAHGRGRWAFPNDKFNLK